MYFNPKVNDLASGVKTVFLGYQKQPPAAKFSVETSQGDQRHLEKWNVLIHPNERHKVLLSPSYMNAT